MAYTGKPAGSDLYDVYTQADVDNNFEPKDATILKEADIGTKVGKVLQVISATNGNVTIATSTPTSIISQTITVKEGSKIHIIFASDRNADTSGAWNYFGAYIDSTRLTRHTSSTSVAAFQDACGTVALTSALSAGTYTISIKAWQGSGTSTWAEDSSQSSLTLMEIGA